MDDSRVTEGAIEHNEPPPQVTLPSEIANMETTTHLSTPSVTTIETHQAAKHSTGLSVSKAEEIHKQDEVINEKTETVIEKSQPLLNSPVSSLSDSTTSLSASTTSPSDSTTSSSDSKFSPSGYLSSSSNPPSETNDQLTVFGDEVRTDKESIVAIVLSNALLKPLELELNLVKLQMAPVQAKLKKAQHDVKTFSKRVLKYKREAEIFGSEAGAETKVEAAKRWVLEAEERSLLVKDRVANFKVEWKSLQEHAALLEGQIADKKARVINEVAAIRAPQPGKTTGSVNSGNEGAKESIAVKDNVKGLSQDKRKVVADNNTSQRQKRAKKPKLTVEKDEIDITGWTTPHLVITSTRLKYTEKGLRELKGWVESSGPASVRCDQFKYLINFRSDWGEKDKMLGCQMVLRDLLDREKKHLKFHHTEIEVKNGPKFQGWY